MPKLIKSDIKNKMVYLIKKGSSLNEISRNTRLSKTTIYYHYRKYYGKKIISPIIKRKDVESLGEFLGVVAGDGYANVTRGCHYLVRIFLNINEDKYADKLIIVLNGLFNKPPHKYIHRKGNCIHIRYMSKDIFNLVTEYLFWKSEGHRSKSRSICLKKIENDDNFKIGFLRGCIDTDGYINKNKIQFATASKGLCSNIEKFLQDLNLEFSTHVYKDKRPNKSPMYHTRIKSIDRDKFLRKISPRNIKVRPGGFEPPSTANL